MHRSRHLWTAVATVVLLSACAEERAPINRVQPNVIRKADLEGEWFYQQTVIDMDTSANYSVIGDNAFWNLERVRWDIQENYLYARRAFEWVSNTDNTHFELQQSNGRAVGMTVTEDGRPYMGAIVAAFRITSHFDIQRQYNPTTGEEINIVAENTTDRPWFDRDYMRVDWAENLATDFDFDYFWYAGGELQIDPVAYYVQENGPEYHQPRFDYNNDGILDYFDIVQQLTVHPATTYYDYYGVEFPTCWFFAHEGVDCATTTLTVRASFMRTNDEEEDYEAMEFKGPIGEVFGFWTTDRLRFSHRDGFNERNRRRFAQRHNIWERSHTEETCQPNVGCLFECDEDSDCEDMGEERCENGQCLVYCTDSEDCPGSGGECVIEDGDDDGVCICDLNAECPTPGSRCDDNVTYQPSVCSLPWGETHFDENCTTDDDCELPGSVCEGRNDGASQCSIPNISRYTSRVCNHDVECQNNISEDSICQNVGLCTIPFRDRTPKPVIFYLTGEWPDDFTQDGMWERLEAEWDWTLRRSVAAAQILSSMELAAEEGDEREVRELQERLGNLEPECDTDDDCDAYWEGSTCATEGPFAGKCETPVREMYHFCHTPVRADDSPECGETGLVVRMGDIRYNQLHYSREWNPLSPLGMSPTAPDPMNGRIFGSTVSLYDMIDVVADNLYETASLINGSLDPEDYVNSEHLGHWLGARRRHLQEAQERTIDEEELREMYRSRSNEWMAGLRHPQSIEHGAPEGYSQDLMPRMLRELRATGTFDADRDHGDGFLHSLHRSPIEAMMMNDEILMASNFPPGTRLTDEVLEQASWASPERRAWQDVQERWFRQHNWGRNILYADMYHVPYEGLADDIKDMSQEEAFQHIRLRTWESVIVHEIGHNFGLYHNFAGSEDVINFPTEWWSARTNGFTTRPRSRLEDPVDDEEIAGGLNDLGYSSVMDYNANYASGERLGSYDRAAILFGYGGALEVYREVEGGMGPADLREWWFSGGSFLRFTTGRPTSLHYTEMYNLMGDDLFHEDNRMILPLSSLSEGDLMTVDDPFDSEGRSYTRVPYLYCNDYRADLGENCHRWDFGFDTYDRMQDIITRDDFYYLRYNFRRGNIGSDAETVINGYYERQLQRFKLMHDYYNLIDSLCHMYYSPEACEEFMTDPRTGFGVYTAAIHDGFNHLAQMITRPDVNLYDHVTRGDGTEIFGESGWITPTAIELPIMEGRYFTTSWSDTNYDDECGVQFWECLHRHGYYINKLLAIQAMAEAETFFVARDTAEDIRMWRISFYDDYSDHIIDLLGGVMSEDYEDMAPYLVPTDEVNEDGQTIGEVLLRNYANPERDPIFNGEIPEGAMVSDPFTGFTVQLYAAVMGFASMHTNFDNRFITASRLWICGGDHGVDPCANDEGVHDPDACDEHGVDTERPIIRFNDPDTGMAYCAVNRASGRGISQRMLLHANDMRARTDYCDRDDPDALDACVAGLSPAERAQAEREMSLYRDQLDIMVHLTARYDNWMFSYGDPFNPGDVPEDW